jgi:hypothetical protein
MAQPNAMAPAQKNDSTAGDRDSRGTPKDPTSKDK